MLLIEGEFPEVEIGGLKRDRRTFQVLCSSVGKNSYHAILDPPVALLVIDGEFGPYIALLVYSFTKGFLCINQNTVLYSVRPER